MTTTAPEKTPDAVLERLERDLAALPDEEGIQRQLAELRTTRENLSARVRVIQQATTTLAQLAPKIDAEQRWLDDLTAWRKALCDELLDMPRRIRDARELGRRQNLEASIVMVDRGSMSGSQWELENLRLGSLMRESGYIEAAKVDNQRFGALPWRGSLPDTERRLADLQRQRDDWQRVLDDALLDDADRERRDRELHEAARAKPTRKTRGDGSHYDVYADGRRVEVEES